MLKDCVHHLGITGAHSLVQNWKAKKWNWIPLYSHTFWQIPKPLWKVSIWIKGQYSLQSGTQAAAPPDLYDHDYLPLALTWLRREENIALLASWANPAIVPFPPFLTTGSEILTVSSELAFIVWSHICGDGQVGFVLCISLLSQLKITLTSSTRVCKTSEVPGFHWKILLLSAIIPFWFCLSWWIRRSYHHIPQGKSGLHTHVWFT